MQMVYVPDGEFKMGSDTSDPHALEEEFPQHSVTLDAFWIDKTEVTNAQYKKCVQVGQCKTSYYSDDSEYNGDNQPVVSVSWNDARMYCAWVGAALPTEAQWEKAARGTDGRIYPWGNQPATCEYAVMYDENGNGCGKNAPWPVGSKPKGASPYGALDMVGNVWEWVEDWYDAYPGSTYKREDFGEKYKVLRGGSWYVGRAFYVRAAARADLHPDAYSAYLGFRCVEAGPGT
jgi:formylglycine-generating enzyme required for sulfatase activity